MERKMDIIGGGKMHVYPASDESPHAPGSTDPNWQESFVLHFWDMKNSVGGYFRIGHEPNFNGGTFALWSNIVTPDGIFHRSEDVAITPGDVTKNGFSAAHGALRYAYENGKIKWKIEEPGVTGNFEIEDFHPAIDGYKRGGEVSDYAPQHVEVACRVTGTVTAQGNTYQVDGLGMRDHGWGIRTWDALLSHRWTIGIFDKDNSFCAVTMHLKSDVIAKFGWVVRGDKVIYADKVEVVTYTECDGLSNRGGFTRMTLTTGEIFEAQFEAVTPCVNSWIHGTACIDNWCKVTWGDKIGVGDFESTANIMRGTHRPRVFDGATIDADGWYPTKQ
jgi:hypothetical protein